MSVPPPGVSFWLAVLPNLLGPSLAAFALFTYVDEHPNAPMMSKWSLNRDFLHATWVRAIVYLVATPVYLSLKNHWKNLKYRHAAWRHGAQPLPVISGNLPFGIDILLDLIKALKVEYAGESLAKFIEASGSKTVLFRVLGEYKGG